MNEQDFKNLIASSGEELASLVLPKFVTKVGDALYVMVAKAQHRQGEAERVTAAAEARKVELDKYNADAEARLAGTEKKIIENEKKIAAQADLQSELDKLKKEYDQYRAKVEKEHAHFAERVG
jgi:hypothetical protein